MNNVTVIEKQDLSGKRLAFCLAEDSIGHYPEFRAFFVRTFDLDRKGLTEPGFVRAPSGLPYILVFIGRSGERFPSGVEISAVVDALEPIEAGILDRDLWAILPKQSGTAPGSVSPVELATYADEQGTLDGTPITVHHLVATIAGGKTDLFSGPENQLLQAELPQQGFALVRKGFVLTPPARPLVPPDIPATAPPAAEEALPAQTAPPAS